VALLSKQPIFQCALQVAVLRSKTTGIRVEEEDDLVAFAKPAPWADVSSVEVDRALVLLSIWVINLVARQNPPIVSLRLLKDTAAETGPFATPGWPQWYRSGHRIDEAYQDQGDHEEHGDDPDCNNHWRK
jgi:hypothetical protein